MSNAEEDFDYSDGEIDEKKHQKLLDKVLSLNKVQQLKKPSRTEPTLHISEFDLVKSATGKKGSIYLDDLTKVLNKKKSHENIRKKLEIANKKSNTLPKPLEKPTADRIRRAVAYEKTRLELDRFEPIVTSNRVSTNLFFPLPSSKVDDKEELTRRWKLKTTFEIEMEKQNPSKVEVINVDVEKGKFPATMKETMEQRKLGAKLRALESYKVAKARRQNKIKSKKFHRIQRKEKIKKQLKEFEELQKTNPEEALKKLEEIERIRAQERFSLRHKSTGKWAKSKQIRAKYDKESRQELAQQLTLSKELTQKINVGSDSEDEFLPAEEVPVEVVQLNSTEENNSWFVTPGKEVKDFVDGYRKYWSDKVENLKENNDKEIIQETAVNMIEMNGKEIIQEDESNNDTLEKFEQEGIIVVNIQKDNMEDSSNKQNQKKQSIKKESKKNKKKERKNTNSKKSLDESLSTSQWDVEIVQGENIDAAFDKLEKNFEKKLQTKLKKIKGQLGIKQVKKKNKKINESEKEKESLLTLPYSKKRPRLDDELIENFDNKNDQTDDSLNDLKNILMKKNETGKHKSNKVNSDKNKNMNINVGTKVMEVETAVPDVSTNTESDDELDKDASNIADMEEAFSDDDLQEDFAKEKSNEVEKSIPKDINLTLPGWGSWGGTGIVLSKRKRRRFIVKAPKKVPRRDDNKGFLIINEDACKKVKEHMVDELPFPFQRVKDFEASIRAPIGRTFVTETAFRKLTKPAVRTKIGAIIEPMDKDVLFKKAS